MRALILVAGAALAVSACSSNEAANNTMEDANMMATDNMMMSNDMMDANMMATDNMMMSNDMNMTNGTMNAMEANDMMTNAPDTNVANGM